MNSGYWYYDYIHYCAECGVEEHFRERVTDCDKPELPDDRREYIRDHCGCIGGRLA